MPRKSRSRSDRVEALNLKTKKKAFLKKCLILNVNAVYHVTPSPSPPFPPFPPQSHPSSHFLPLCWKKAHQRRGVLSSCALLFLSLLPFCYAGFLFSWAMFTIVFTCLHIHHLCLLKNTRQAVAKAALDSLLPHLFFFLLCIVFLSVCLLVCLTVCLSLLSPRPP